MEAVPVLESEIFQGIPFWFIILIVFAFLVLLLFIMLISWIFHAEQEAKKKVHHVPTPHEVVVELQRELLKNMESASKQNWLMIWLTILFITVSVLGGAVIIGFFQNIKDFFAPWVAWLIEYMNSIFSQ
jgi:flagellar basal body-associated protein FliL